MKKTALPKTTKSPLAKQAERLFSFHDQSSISTFPESYTMYPGEPRIVPSFTTYSVCEDPIPNDVLKWKYQS